jgi:hypothetical protein
MIYVVPGGIGEPYSAHEQDAGIYTGDRSILFRVF